MAPTLKTLKKKVIKFRYSPVTLEYPYVLSKPLKDPGTGIKIAGGGEILAVITLNGPLDGISLHSRMVAAVPYNNVPNWF